LGTDSYTYYKYTNKLRIVTFEPLKKVYNYDEKIAFRIKSNKDAYYYLHTQKEGTTKMIPLKGDENNRLKANVERKIGYYVIKNYVGDEKVRLTISTVPIERLNSTLDKKTYTKELAFVGGIKDEHNEDGEYDYNEQDIPIKYEKRINLEIEIYNSSYKLGEDVDIDITSSQGYIHTFEATPTDVV